MGELPEILAEIDEHLACDSTIPVELAARFLCALPVNDLPRVAEILSRFLGSAGKD